MSYSVNGTSPELLAANIAPERWHCSIGVPVTGVPEDVGYSGDELELESLVALAWQVRQDNRVIIVSPCSTGLQDTCFEQMQERAALVNPAYSPRYMSSSAGTVAFATSIPFARVALSVLGKYACFLVSNLGPGLTVVSLIEDGIGISGPITSDDIVAVAKKLSLSMNFEHPLMVQSTWATSFIDESRLDAMELLEAVLGPGHPI